MFVVIIIIIIITIIPRTAMEISVLSSFDPYMLKMKVKKTDTVLDVKTAVMEAYGIPIANQQLKFKGRILLDNDQLSLYKIKKIVSYG